MAHRLAQPGVQQNLGVVVGVHVDEPGDNPLALGVDDLGAAGVIERAEETVTTTPSRMPSVRVCGAPPVPSNHNPSRMITS